MSLAEAIERYRTRRGLQADAMGEGWVTAAWHATLGNPDHAGELDAVRATLERDGRWSERWEWRISTWFDSSIASSEQHGNPTWLVTVACDGQQFSAHCPTIEKAYAVLRSYEQMIVAQCYSVGPPWAG